MKLWPRSRFRRISSTPSREITLAGFSETVRLTGLRSLWPDSESSEAAENSLTFAVLWLDRTSHSSRRGFITGLRLIVPRGAGLADVHRFHALHPKLNLELYESDSARETLERVDANSVGNLETWLVPHRETQLLLDRARSTLDHIAPLQRFHPTTDVLLRYLTPELEVVRVGLAESWRSGLRVVNRQ